MKRTGPSSSDGLRDMGYPGKLGLSPGENVLSKKSFHKIQHEVAEKGLSLLNLGGVYFLFSFILCSKYQVIRLDFQNLCFWPVKSNITKIFSVFASKWSLFPQTTHKDS